MMVCVNRQVENYLQKMIIQFEQNKLTDGEKIQLFQDLFDTGLIHSLDNKFIKMGIVLWKKKLIKLRLREIYANKN